MRVKYFYVQEFALNILKYIEKQLRSVLSWLYTTEKVEIKWFKNNVVLIRFLLDMFIIINNTANQLNKKQNRFSVRKCVLLIKFIYLKLKYVK